MIAIKFRGYSKECQRWVYGYYYGGFNWADFIIEDAGFEHRVQVIPETIGQFTGLFDKNGKEIYEGDISIDKLNRKHIVEFHHGGYWIRTFKTLFSERLHSDSQIDVIGNIHDNPELLTEKQ